MSVKQGINFHLTDFNYFLSVLNVLNILYAFLVILIIALISLIPSVAQSHKLNIFAYAEGDKIFTESYFNDGSPCKKSMIQVYDPEGNELLKGKTDEEGTFSFKVPRKTDLRIVLTASMGHKAEYRMPESEITDILNQKIEPYLLPEEPIPYASSKEDLQKIEPSPFIPFIEGKGGEIADQNNISSNSTQPNVAVDLDQIRSVVEDAVDRSIEKRMKPLISSMIHSMIRAQTRQVSLTDIIGGIGYIFGIMGLILYFKKRDK